MFCLKCGNELPDGSSFCNRCGYQQGDQSSGNKVAAYRTRHGFTTFWLWFWLAVSAVLGIILIFSEDTALLGIFCLLDAVSYFMLLQWKKVGFYIGVIAGIVQMLIAPGQDDMMEMLEMGINPVMVNLLALILTMGLLFWILNFKNRNGKSTWSQLEKFY